MQITRLRPSRNYLIAIAAIVLLVAGTAVAGPGDIGRALTKSKVKTIAKKQANREITRRASALTVAKAQTADRATTATTAQSANPVAYARIAPSGQVIAADSKVIGAANVTLGTVPGYYCLNGLPFEPRGGSATIDFDSLGPTVDSLAVLGIRSDAAGSCPANTQAFVDIRKPDGLGSQAAGFFLTLYG